MRKPKSQIPKTAIFQDEIWELLEELSIFEVSLSETKAFSFDDLD